MQSRRMLEEWKHVFLNSFTLLLLHNVLHNNPKNRGIGETHRYPYVSFNTWIENWVLHKQLLRVLQHQKNFLPSLLQRKPENPAKNITIISFFLSFVGHKTCFWWRHLIGWKKNPHYSFPPLFQTLNQCWSYENLYLHCLPSWNQNMSVWNVVFNIFFSGLKFMCKLNVIVCLICLLDCHS